jgi:hypothetical protein
MKHCTTGTGLVALSVAILGSTLIARFGPAETAANAANPAAMATAVAVATTAQATPNIVWYGAVAGYANSSGEYGGQIFRAWSDGKVEARGYRSGSTNNGNQSMCSGFWACPTWIVVSDSNQGYNAAADINFDSKVDGDDLGQLLAAWGDAPRHDIPPSDCPLNLINP